MSASDAPIPGHAAQDPQPDPPAGEQPGADQAHLPPDANDEQPAAHPDIQSDAPTGPPPPPPEPETTKPPAKEKTSWAATALAVPVRVRTRSRASKAKVKAANGVPGTEKVAEHSEEKQTTKRRKISLFKRITFICTSCVSSSPRTHDVDVGEGASVQTDQKDPEKGLDTAEHPSREASSSTTIVPPIVPSSAGAPPTPPKIDTDIADTDDDVAVLVPPTPTKLLPISETDGLTSGAVQPPGSTGDENKQEVRVTVSEPEDDESDGNSFEDEPFADAEQTAEWEDDEQRLIRQGGSGIPIGPDGSPQPLLPAISSKHLGRKCLVLDLDETLVHSSLRPVPAPDYIVPVEIENNWHNFYVLKRPGVDNFLRRMGEMYEVVVFTASLAKYADPVLDKLDPTKSVAHRLFRESCFNHRGNYVKDLSQLGRPVCDTIILDNSPASYIFHPHNAVPVSSWFNDPHDTELTDLCPFLEDLAGAQDVRGVLNPYVEHS